MGTAHSSRGPVVCNLKKTEVADIVKTTHFTAEEVKALWVHFRMISSPGKDEHVLDRKEFQNAIGMKASVYVYRMFDVFDSNKDGAINFDEFIDILSILSTKASPHEKLAFSFKLYDLDEDGFISTEELTTMLRATAEEHELVLTDEQISSVVDATFAELPQARGRISLDHYSSLVNQHPMMLSQLTLNISTLVAEQVQGGEIPLGDSKTPR
eukprot:CAMPEP_0118974340 /NCGR_PEP_ID=MMETSP1173-20130426/11200_1 /TAXON_ID=1034831 /ORGANISM="Rhizochromulina marina cf, Strain CCMP1243" /LENGTH=211 /DNA_ID=CAMNT_0006924059 /DNA_START=63 /DNA_END=698 /DNA_ORIENTATION=+